MSYLVRYRFFGIHPIGMLIISQTMPDMVGGRQESGWTTFAETLMFHHLAMSLYITLLGAVIGFSRLALDPGGQVEKIRSYLEKIRRSLNFALDLIGPSRTLIGFESGKIPISLIQEDVCRCVQDIIPTFETTMAGKGLSIDTQLGDQPVLAAIEPSIFRHTILSNLLSNAIKFSLPQGKITIRIDSRNGETLISFSNTGPGIPEEKQAVLFSVTAGTGTPGTMGERGTGLGLPLSYKFIRLMGGRINVISQPDPGAPPGFLNTFQVVLTNTQ